MPVNLDDLLTGGQINEAGKAAGVTDADLTGGNFTPEARARLEAEAAEPDAPEEDAEGEPTKAELQARADELGIARSGTKAEISERIAEAEEAADEDDDEGEDD